MKKVLDYVLKDREIVFSCSHCGCIYVAGEEDYDVEKNDWDDYLIVCECPKCGEKHTEKY